MSGELILLTGGSGHIGYRTLIEALSKGYKVRAAVRSQSKADEISTAEPTKPYLDNLTFILVPDIEKNGAYAEAVEDVDYVVHLASPLPKPSDDLDATIVQPAIRGTLSMLKCALKEPSIRRVVITSSAVAVEAKDINETFTADSIRPDPQGPFDNVRKAYNASKTIALNTTRDFIAQQKPHFTVVNIMPSYVIGPNKLAKTPADARGGTNRFALSVLFGVQMDGVQAATVHVDDVAFLHIASLDPKIEGNRNFGANVKRGEPRSWEDAIEIVKKRFPKEIETGVFPLGGHQPTIPTLFDASETERVFGIKFKDFEEQVVDAAGYYAQVVAASS
jgi:nucleoside-diphosphate-sugar epimerase